MYAKRRLTAEEFMATAFCSKCGSPITQGSQFCPKCGWNLGNASSGAVPVTQAAVTPAAAPAKSHTMMIVAVVVVVIVVVVLILALLYAAGTFTPSTSGGGGSGATPQSENLVNSQGATLGPGTGDASVIPFTVPSGVTSASVIGWLNVTTCSGSGNCNAYAFVITPTSWANYVSGGSVSVIWCYTTSSTCSPLQYTSILATGLSAYAGTSLDLVFFNTDTLFSQTYTASAFLIYTT
jgi:hypothetical protein